MAGSNTVAAKGTGQPRLFTFYIFRVQGIVRAVSRATHAQVALVVDVHTERIDVLQIAHNGANGAIGDAVHHFALFARNEQHNE